MKESVNELQWHKWRHEGIGASESPVVYLGRVFSTTRTSLFIKKRSGPQDAVNTDDNPDFRRGHTYEPLAAERFGKKTGIKTFYPADDDDRYGPRFCLMDPDHPHRRVSLDGICDDGWILEIKSPRQFSCDKIKSEGLKDYYQIQAAYQAAVAQKVGTFAWGPGECKGVRLCVWEPDAADVIVIELPYDSEFSKLVTDAVDSFWTNNVQAGIPPDDVPVGQPVKAKGGKYHEVDSDAWREATAKLVLAKDTADAALARLEIAKDTIKAAMREAQRERVILPNGVKFILSEQAGRKTVDMDLLLHEHPNIDLERYQRQGKPSEMFRVYGVQKIQREDDEQEVSGLAVELAHFATGNVDPEQLIDQFDDLRSRTEIYTRTLRNEAEVLEEQLKQVGEACKRKMFGGKQ